jgi:hypothetical protein
VRRALGALALVLLPACAAQLERPQSFTEQAAYLEAGARAASRSISDLTCLRWNVDTEQCASAGKPLHPRKAKELMVQVEGVRKGLRAATALGPEGGTCLDVAVESPEKCLGLVRELLLEVEQYLRDQGSP